MQGQNNEAAWDKKVDDGAVWTRALSPQAVAQAKCGALQPFLSTGQTPIPRDWLPTDLTGKQVLCLASGATRRCSIFPKSSLRKTILSRNAKI